MKNALLLLPLTFAVLACATLLQATPTPTKIPVPPAAPSATLPAPTPTPSPFPTATPWPTFPVSVASPYPTPTATRELDCQLNWQSPGNGKTYKPRDTFSVGWKVTNTGRAIWYPGTVQFTYLAGAKLYDDPLVTLRSTVSPGQSVILSVGMTAPKNSRMYTTRWSLRQGATFFCPVSVSIYVAP